MYLCPPQMELPGTALDSPPSSSTKRQINFFVVFLKRNFFVGFLHTSEYNLYNISLQPSSEISVCSGALGPEQIRHLTAESDSALITCLEALLPPSIDARTLIDIGAVYVNRVR